MGIVKSLLGFGPTPLDPYLGRNVPKKAIALSGIIYVIGDVDDVSRKCNHEFHGRLEADT